MKDIRKFLEKKDTAKDFTIEEVMEFLKSNIYGMAKELETTREDNITIRRQEFYDLIVELKQTLDKLKETEKNCECDCEACFSCEHKGSGVVIEREEN